jgi:hypothetical protein
MTEELFDSRQGQIFVLRKVSIQALGPTCSRIQSTLGLFAWK